MCVPFPFARGRTYRNVVFHENAKNTFFSILCVDIMIVDKSVETVNNPDFTAVFQVDEELFSAEELNFLRKLRNFLTNGGDAFAFRKALAIVAKSNYNTQGIVSYGNGEGK